MIDPNPANLSREARRILNEAPTISEPPAPGFIVDAAEIALAAYDDAYTAEYTATGATDNKTAAMKAAVEAVVQLCSIDQLAAKDAEIARLREALGAMIYETTSLSSMEDDGSHWCRITKEALELARAAYHGADAIAALKRKGEEK